MIVDPPAPPAPLASPISGPAIPAPVYPAPAPPPPPGPHAACSTVFCFCALMTTSIENSFSLFVSAGAATSDGEKWQDQLRRERSHRSPDWPTSPFLFIYH